MKTKTTRTKVKASPVLVENEAEFLELCNEVALLKQKKLVLKGEIARYSERIKKEIKELDAQDKALTTRAEKFASAHREDLLPTGKSRKTALAWWGFRSTQASVKPIAGLNEQEAISLILEIGELDTLVKFSYSLDKNGILNSYRRGILSADELRKNGLRIAEGKGEEFFIDALAEEEELDNTKTQD